MRIGILTFHKVPNYGAFLQAYCLAEAVRHLGHTVEIINYVNRSHEKMVSFKPWVYRRPMRFWHDFNKYRAVHRAMAQMPLSSFATDAKGVNWQAYDAVVVGSDIVWNHENARLGRDPVYFGQFPSAFHGRLIAYAPSIGSMPPDYEVQSWVKDGLQQFHSILVRDENTRRFVQNQLGFNPEIVADPTWLPPGEGIGNGDMGKRTRQKFLLVYALPLEGQAVDSIQSFARDQGLKTVAVGYWQPWCDENWGDVDPFEWIALVRQAAHAVVGTFHGTLYSVREKTNFCTLSHPLVDSRVITPLTLVGLEGRRTTDMTAIGEVLRASIDHEVVEKKRSDYANESLGFLRAALVE